MPDGRNDESGNANDAAGARDVAGEAQKTIGKPASGQIAQSACEQRKTGVKAHLLQVEAAMSIQIGGEPIQVDGKRVLVAEIHQRQLPHGSAGKDAAPRNTNADLPPRTAGGGMDQIELGSVDAAMLFGRVAIVEEPDCGPHQAEHGESEKGHAPAVAQDHPDHQRRSDGGAQPRAGMRDALREAAFGREHPAR